VQVRGVCQERMLTWATDTGTRFRPMSQIPEPFRPSRKLLRAVADLHTRGFQRLRIVPYLYDLGTWRCMIAPAQWISAQHGARLADGISWEDTAPYTEASGREYWGWKDDKRSSPGELADVFLDRYRGLAELGYGEDWVYVGWYQHMLHITFPDALPIAEGSYVDTDGFMTTVGRTLRFALPPAGHAQTHHRT
jgi:hypothetical protein